MRGKGIQGISKKLMAGATAVSLVLVFLLVLGITIGRRGKTVSRDTAGEATGLSGYDRTAEIESVEDKGRVAQNESQAPESDVSEAGSMTAETGSGDLLAELNKNIKTATVGIEVKKGGFDKNYSELLLLAEKYGGYVSDSKTSSEDGRITGGNVTMRIPAGSFSKVIEECKGLGEVNSLDVQTEDVTDQYVDIDSRIRNLRAQESVYLNLMSKAQTIEESITVQRELSTLQGQIEQLVGQKNYLDNRIQYSTISVYMNEAGAAPVETGGGWGFMSALGDAVHGVVDGFNVIIRFLGYSFVYIMLAVLIGLGVRFYMKRRNRNKPAADGSPA